MDDPATRARKSNPREHVLRASGPSWRGPVAVVVAVLAVMAAPVVLARLLSPDEPGWTSNGITLNTGSWEPGDAANKGIIVSVVHIDANGCVYLGNRGSVRNVVWPAGYTASRQPDRTVTISNPDSVVVAATGHRLRAGGGEAPPDTDLACRAQGSNDPPLTIQDELPPLKD